MTSMDDSTTSDPDRLIRVRPGDDGIYRANWVLTPEHLTEPVVLQLMKPLPLPGIVILVHGVNSDGEWFAAAEEGLCKGLNTRLGRDPDSRSDRGGSGRLSPASYLPELTPDGFINPKRDAKTFVQADGSFSPVIRFRFGYKSSAEELQQFGDGIYLNEANYWGGGPFANGCSSLPDLWAEGLNEELFLWLHVQHLNPTNDRQVFSCPPRPYFVLAAYRLAKLVESIRRLQADVPITIVCHSQGNMVGMAAAFLGDRLPEVTDARQRRGRCVADAYVLCNAPYSLAEDNFTESWSQRGMADRQGRTGRQTYASRTRTMAAFFDIIGQQAQRQQPDAYIDEHMETASFAAATDREKHGLGKQRTGGRVTLYCNPHDQVISAATVQGIGWRGLSAGEIEATKGSGVFAQRVFAQGFEVGSDRKTYDYWADHYRKPANGSPAFWFPESPPAKYSIAKGWAADKNVLAKIMTVVTAPALLIVMGALGPRINALPPKVWRVPLEAPPFVPPFMPQALRFGQTTDKFDQDFDMPGSYRDPARPRETSDPYAGDRTASDGRTDAPRGTWQDEAALRYEHHADLRMQAKREKLYANDQKVTEEDEPATASDQYKAWRGAKIKANLAENIDTHATDHSTIMTNPMHAEKALAYDVALGVCDGEDVSKDALAKLRVVADWRLLEGLGDDDPHKRFLEYFDKGKMNGESPYKWATQNGSVASMPDKIVDEREFRASSRSGNV